MSNLIAISDDGSRLDAADIEARLTTALNALKAIASTGLDDADADLLLAEQAIRRARRRVLGEE